MDNSALSQKYQLILERRVEPDPEDPKAFPKFLEKRASGAHKIAESSRAKGGYATLTAIHFEAKAKPYKEAMSVEKKHEGD